MAKVVATMTIKTRIHRMFTARAAKTLATAATTRNKARKQKVTILIKTTAKPARQGGGG